LKKSGLRRNRAPFEISRTEEIRNSEDPALPTYKQIVSESIKNANTAYTDYKERIDKIQKERLNLTQEMNRLLAKERKKQAFVLARPQLIKEKADQVIQQMQEKMREYRERIKKRTR
jgi:hypothetical protein